MDAAVHVRPLSDDDRDAVLALLLPTEERSTFLVGNALETGITDRGGPRNGLWLGAFRGAHLEGVVSHARGPGSLVPACGGHAPALLAEAARQGVQPRLIVGTAERVEEARRALPPAWRAGRTQRETLMVLRWERRAPGPALRLPAVVTVLAPEHVEAAAGLLDVLTVSSGLPQTPSENLDRARRMAGLGSGVVALVDGRPVALSSRAAATGRYVHVGATVTDPAWRRLGLSAACVERVLDRAHGEGAASRGAVLFTGEHNHPALALYERLGFRRDGPFDMLLMDP